MLLAIYCTLYICMYIYLLVFQFSLLSTFCQCQMWQQMRKYAWTRVAVVVSVSSPPSSYQTNHKNRISFRLFISVSLFPFFLCWFFYASCSAFIDSRASNGAACFHFNYGARLGRLKCEYIHHTLCWDGRRGA